MGKGLTFPSEMEKEGPFPHPSPVVGLDDDVEEKGLVPSGGVGPDSERGIYVNFVHLEVR